VAGIPAAKKKLKLKKIESLKKSVAGIPAAKKKLKKIKKN